jgi:hypothetical protein
MYLVSEPVLQGTTYNKLLINTYLMNKWNVENFLEVLDTIKIIKKSGMNFKAY